MAGDSLTSWHNRRAFSTYDRDNDASSSNCAVDFHGAWWYQACWHSNLNGRYYDSAVTTRSDGIAWHHWKRTDNYSMKRASMKIRPTN